VFDDVVLATAAMPGPSTGGGTETPPATPTTLSATAVASGRIDLAWTDASSDETAFHVERSPSGGGVFAEIAVLGANVTAYADTAVAAETGYSYRVRAANAAGFSAYSPTAEATTPPVVTAPPEAPTTLSATAATSTRIDLTWTDASATETAVHVERAPAGGSFDEVATLGANVAAYSDPGVTADTTYSYRVRASNGAGFSAYSTTVDVTTPAGPDPATLKTMSFEDGSLTDPISGADAVRGTVLLETTVPISGQASARVPAAARSYLEEHFTPEGDLYVSFDLRLETLPSSDVRLALLSSDGTSVGNLLLRSSGRLSLRLASTTVGAESPPLVAGQLYRIGVRQKAGGGSAVLEGFLAGYDDPFGAPFASTASGTWTAADRLRLGSTTGAVDATFDNLTLNTGGLADPSVD
jgi:hypothetical protein